MQQNSFFSSEPVIDRQHREDILKDIALGVATPVGIDSLISLTEYLSKALKVDFAFVGKLIQPEADCVATLAMYGKKLDSGACQARQTIDNFTYHLANTPCGNVINKGFCVYPQAVRQLFPRVTPLEKIKAESYAGMPILDRAGQTIGLLCVVDSKPFTDTTSIEEVLKIFATRATAELERQQAKLILRESEQKFRGVFNQTFQFMVLLSPNGILLEANQNSLDFINLNLADVVGQPFWSNPWWSKAANVQRRLKKAIVLAKSGEMVSYEADIFGADGKAMTVDFSLKPLRNETGEVVFLIAESRDITEYKRAERKNREQAALLNIATDAIMVRGLNNRLLFWNRGAEKLYGWTQTEVLKKNAEFLARRSLTKLFEIQQTTISKGEWQGELNQITKLGREIVVESRWTLVKDELDNPKSFLIVNTDITEQKQLEAQFLRTQRLESLGTLAGGIAHDLNNILTPIIGFSKLLPLQLPDINEKTKGFFKIIETNANRGSALVNQILAFSRGLEGERGIVQIRHLITEIEQMVNEAFPKSIELKTNVPKNLWTVNADINQLHQVLMNLAVNARDAMPDGGTLIINAENTMVNNEYARLHLDAKEGSYVLVSVTDTGTGIPREIIDRIFEPFFTTKEVGRGTGLGLSTAIGIIKSHGGFVEVTSQRQKNRGTQFKIFLPACDIAVSNLKKPEEMPYGNGELVLVVDDETAILSVTKAILEAYNYKVLTASNGIDAIATYARDRKAELVIVDIMMPGMDGKTVIRTLKRIDPELKIIAVSGLIERQDILAELGNNVIAFISKPYANNNLLKIVHEIISA